LGRVLETIGSAGDAKMTIAGTEIQAASGGSSLTWSTVIGIRAYNQGLSTVQNYFFVSAPLTSNMVFNGYAGTEAAGTAFAFLSPQDTGTSSFTWPTEVPSSYVSGNLTVYLDRVHSSASGAVRWSVKTSCQLTPVYATDLTWNTATAQTDSSPATTATYTAIATNVDVTGCSAGSRLLIHVSRLASDGADTNTGTIDIYRIKASF
jgi:hypothetical protein